VGSPALIRNHLGRRRLASVFLRVIHNVPEGLAFALRLEVGFETLKRNRAFGSFASMAFDINKVP
ncbi:hypothetical protein, partial [Bacillus velezensis]|uniref:hypothetical protein n=1 Tax=Bacillus velezensis TaxID=492670 RepID=UPI001E614FE4